MFGKIPKNLKGDFTGGLTAGLLPLPRGMALGALVFTPLGPEYIPYGITAGVMASAISNIGAAFWGGMPFMNNAPFSLSTFMLLSALEIIVAHLGGINAEGIGPTAMALLFLTVFFNGIFLVGIGMLRLGDLAKFIPYPVLSGLINGTSLLILRSQWKPFLGLSKSATWGSVISDPSQIQGFTVLVGIIVCVSIWLGPKISKRVPAPLYGIVTGVAAYYVLEAMGFGKSLGPVVGSIPGAIPLPRYAMPMAWLFGVPELLPLIGKLSGLALGVAAINALRTLVVCSAGADIAQQRFNANRELMGQGIGNALGSLFGGLSTAGSLSSTLSNHAYGGRTSLSRVSAGLFPLFVLLALHPLVSRVPNVVLAGMLAMIAIKSFDKWSLDLFKRVVVETRKRDYDPLINLAQVVIVVTALLAFGIFEALGAGFILSVMWFVLRMGKAVIRNEYTGATMRSNTLRPAEENHQLDAIGGKIHLLELQGSLFFGTADKIAARAEELFAKEIGFLIFDFRRIAEIDSTGAKLVGQLSNKCRKKGVHLYLASVEDSTQSTRHRELLNLLSPEQKELHLFDSREVAMAVAEDRLLDQTMGRGRYSEEIPLPQVGLMGCLTPAQVEALEGYLDRKTFQTGETVFSQGSAGDSIFLIVKGRARILIPQESGKRLRISTLCTGTCFGEMALLDGEPRSADVVAVGELVCYRLSHDNLMVIHDRQPEVAYKIILGLVRELSHRLRVSNTRNSAHQ